MSWDRQPSFLSSLIKNWCNYVCSFITVGLEGNGGRMLSRYFIFFSIELYFEYSLSYSLKYGKGTMRMMFPAKETTAIYHKDRKVCKAFLHFLLSSAHAYLSKDPLPFTTRVEPSFWYRFFWVGFGAGWWNDPI